MKKIILIIILGSLLFSCTSEEEIKKEEEKNAEQLRKQEKEKIIDKLVSKYNIQYKWDTLDYDFSINYKPVIDSKHQLIDDVIIKDIYEKDSTKYVSIQAGLYSSFYFDFPITKEQENEFIEKDNEVILVVSISEIRKMKLALEGEIEDSESATVNLGNSTDFIGRGKIIDIVSIIKQTSE